MDSFLSLKEYHASLEEEFILLSNWAGNNIENHLAHYIPPSDNFLHHHDHCEGYQWNFFIDNEMGTVEKGNLDWQGIFDRFMEGFGETYREEVHSLSELCKHYKDKGS